MTANELTGNCTQVPTTDPNLVGKVVATDPPAGTQVKKNSQVTIQIGQAQNQQVTVPTVTQLSLKDAKKALQGAGLAVGTITGSQDDNAVVLSQDPQANSQVPEGTPVNLVAVDQNNGGNGGGDNGGGIFGGVTGTSAREED
jgi:serine/threonine-protein kinase